LAIVVVLPTPVGPMKATRVQRPGLSAIPSVQRIMSFTKPRTVARIRARSRSASAESVVRSRPTIFWASPSETLVVARAAYSSESSWGPSTPERQLTMVWVSAISRLISPISFWSIAGDVVASRGAPPGGVGSPFG